MPQGYLHKEMDVKILILFILARVETPLDVSVIYEIAYQDESLNYFVLADCLASLTETGHIDKDINGCYTITEKGRSQGAFVEDSLAVPVVQKVTEAITRKVEEIRQASFITTEISQDEGGNWMATLRYDEVDAPMMHLTLRAPNEPLAHRMANNMKKKMFHIYKVCFDAATDADRKPITEN